MNSKKEASDNVGTYEEKKFPEFRNPTLDVLDLGQKKHHIPLLIEVDVTQARDYIRAFKVEMGEKISFTGWVMKCISQAVSEHRYIHAMRKGKKSLILFDDVDISIVIERLVDRNKNSLETLPMPYVLRKANQKTVKEITAEIRMAQEELLEEGEVQIGTAKSAYSTRFFTLIPKFIRHLLVWQRFAKDPFFAKRTMGTVAVTSIGSAAKYSGYGWAIPIGIHPVIFALGNIAKKAGVIHDEIKIREYLSMTILFDHDVTDGAPVFRFTQRLNELLENAYSLDE